MVCLSQHGTRVCHISDHRISLTQRFLQEITHFCISLDGEGQTAILQAPVGLFDAKAVFYTSSWADIIFWKYIFLASKTTGLVRLSPNSARVHQCQEIMIRRAVIFCNGLQVADTYTACSYLNIQGQGSRDNRGGRYLQPCVEKVIKTVVECCACGVKAKTSSKNPMSSSLTSFPKKGSSSIIRQAKYQCQCWWSHYLTRARP